MGSKFYDIPFRCRSAKSDFCCKDGELMRVDGVNLKDENGDSFTLPADFTGESGGETLSGVVPTPEISFALVRDILPGWHIHPDVYPSKILAASETSMEYWTKLAAQMLAAFQSEACRRNLYVAPFLVFAAWKTAGGLYLSPTSPQLMIPNSDVPLVATDGDISQQELEIKVAGAVCSLRFKMRAPEVLRNFVGKIESLEVFVSNPIHNYNTFLSFLPQRRVSSTSWCRCLDESTGVIANRLICTEIQPLAWKAMVENRNSAGLKYRAVASIPLGEIDLLEDWTAVSSGSDPLEDWESEEITYAGLSSSSVSDMKSATVTIEGRGEEIDVETRPLKLSGAGEFKLMAKVFLRGRFREERLKFSVYASRDMRRWWPVAVSTGGAVVGLPRSYFRFYRFRIEGRLEEGENLQGITIIEGGPKNYLWPTLFEYILFLS